MRLCEESSFCFNTKEEILQNPQFFRPPAALIIKIKQNIRTIQKD